MDSYFYQSCDYSSFGAIPPHSTSTDFDLPYSSIFDPKEEEDQQLLLDLQSFLSDSISPDPYYNFPAPHHTEPSLHLPPQNNNSLVQDQFLVDFDYSALFPIIQDPFPFEPLLPEPAENDYLTEPADYYFTEPAPKRQKFFHYEPPPQYSNCYSGYLAPAPLQEIYPKQGSFCACTYQAVNGGFESKGKEGGPRATAQSVAARDRRKKISDKTQELGKLVPGASNSKMNTAEMLHSAFKYVKFLQAQVSLLQLMASDSSSQTDNLKIVASREVQEKLYMKEKCIVPVEFLEELAENDDVQSQGSIAKDLKQLMKSVSAEN
ncbi:hypothetical protein V2J09_008067 [Rumex salicifolius]